MPSRACDCCAIGITRRARWICTWSPMHSTALGRVASSLSLWQRRSRLRSLRSLKRCGSEGAAAAPRCAFIAQAARRRCHRLLLPRRSQQRHLPPAREQQRRGARSGQCQQTLASAFTWRCEKCPHCCCIGGEGGFRAVISDFRCQQKRKTGRAGPRSAQDAAGPSRGNRNKAYDGSSITAFEHGGPLNAHKQRGCPARLPTCAQSACQYCMHFG